MFVVGELRDKKMLDQMRDELFAMGIAAQTHYSEKDDIYFLTVDEQKDLPKALDYYWVKLGIPRPLQNYEEWTKIRALPRGHFTFSILVVCIVFYSLSFTEMGRRLYDVLFMGVPETGFLYEIKHGQIWRLLTPIFIHLSIFHIFFNMLWFKDLGYLIEHKFGRNYLLMLILISGTVSNLLQYCVSGPQFGGMSGVLYAMLGFIWVYKEIHIEMDYSLPSRDIFIMIGWLLLCLTGFLGPIANTAHASGLFVGMLFALFKAPEAWGKAHFKYISLAVIFLAFTIGVEGLKLGGRYYLLLWQ